MPKVCSVPQCGATARNARDRSFHQFPQEASLRRAWIKRLGLGRGNFQPKNNSSVCSHHFGEEHFRQPNNETPAQFRKAKLKLGSLPTYNLVNFPESFVSPSGKFNNCLCEEKKYHSRNSRRKIAKKRKLDAEFRTQSPKSHESPKSKNEDLQPNNTAMERNSVSVLVIPDEDIPPERSSSPPDVSKSRRKAPRSQVRKVVRNDLQNEETNILQILESESTLKERFQEPNSNKKQEDDQDLSGKCPVSPSAQNGDSSLQTLASEKEHGCITANEANETTGIEEDYQRKYFQLLNTMNELQDKFLISQRNFEDLVKAREDFIEELKSQLESNHQEIASMHQELETRNDKIAEFEKERKTYEDKVQNLDKKVEEMKMKGNEREVKDRVLNEGAEELQRTLGKQQEVLEFYKLLTSVTVERVTEDENEERPRVYDRFRCSVKTMQTQELQFLLTHDHEFAEVEYMPLDLDTVNSTLPNYLKEQIFFESDQGPNFLCKLIKSFQTSNGDQYS
ncbi:uncharacterized protein LOC114528221 isoform X2 [Dendronephthya gigantea]|uniref:uncharacterized protein LOC114528221 isoform X2 n=1 Tax=Dendronephthya gigantea TaxID=151771 RepID=UPI00106AB2B2|nr:uncharacterized protein LOC114528221 isoform X2 [Dendronephthya gigantea]